MAVPRLAVDERIGGCAWFLGSTSDSVLTNGRDRSGVWALARDELGSAGVMREEIGGVDAPRDSDGVAPLLACVAVVRYAEDIAGRDVLQYGTRWALVELRPYDHAEAAAVQISRLRERVCGVWLDDGTFIVIPDTTLGVMLNAGRRVADPCGSEAWRVRDERYAVPFRACAGVSSCDPLDVRWYVLVLLRDRCRVEVCLEDVASAVALGLCVCDERVCTGRVPEVRRCDGTLELVGSSVSDVAFACRCRRDVVASDVLPVL